MKNELHLIEEDLKEGWVLTAVLRVEGYLSKWARFQERHGV